MPNTPVYALPYPALSDPPNGPAQIGSLATATEAGLTTVNSNANTKGPGHRLVANTVLTTATGTFAGTELNLMSTTWTSAGASEVYRIEFKGNFSSGTGTPNINVTMRWKTGNVVVANTDAYIDGVGNYPLVINTGYPVYFSGVVTGVPAGLATVAIFGTATNGVATSMSGAGPAGNPIRWLRVWDEGV